MRVSCEKKKERKDYELFYLFFLLVNIKKFFYEDCIKREMNRKVVCEDKIEIASGRSQFRDEETKKEK